MSLRIAYLVNQYPKVSHSFIRREIRALEALGASVCRISVRGWSDTLVDAQDVTERERTRYVLKGGVLALAVSALWLVCTTPMRFARAIGLACRTGWRADRPIAVHLIYLLEACVVARWLRAERIEHLHAHFGTNSAQVAMLAGLLAPCPYSFTVHGPEEFDRPEFLALAEKVRRSAFVVTVSSYGRSQVLRWIEHCQWPKVQVVRCGIELSQADAPPAAPFSPTRLVCVGRLCEQKGQLLLLEALRRVIDRGFRAELVLAGDGEMRQAIDQRVAELGLEPLVRITGWIDGPSVQRELESARALVLASFAEGLPVVIMEAMALARPVISTFVAGIPELVLDKRTGWLVPAGDVEALSQALELCLRAGVDELDAMGRRGRERVIEMHDVRLEAQRLLGLMQPGVLETPVSAGLDTRD